MKHLAFLGGALLCYGIIHLILRTENVAELLRGVIILTGIWLTWEAFG